MSKISFPFKHLDEFLFKMSSDFRNGPLYEEIHDKLSFLSDQQLKVLVKSLTLFLFFLPIFLVLWVFILNTQMKSRIKTQQELMVHIQEISQKQKSIDIIQKQITSPKPLATKSNFENIIKNVLNLRQIDLNLVNIELFELSDLNSTINRINTEITFNNFSINNFTEILTSLTDQEKATISKLFVKKDIKTQTLNGSIDLILYGKK